MFGTAMDIENMTGRADDGKAAHLTGMRIPSIILSATNGANVDLSGGG